MPDLRLPSQTQSVTAVGQYQITQLGDSGTVVWPCDSRVLAVSTTRDLLIIVRRPTSCATTPLSCHSGVTINTWINYGCEFSVLTNQLIVKNFNQTKSLFNLNLYVLFLNYFVAIHSGTIKILYIISGHSCKELEVVASVYMKNLSKQLNRKVIKWGGHRGLGLRS